MRLILIILFSTAITVGGVPVQSDGLIRLTQDVNGQVFSLITDSRFHLPFFNDHRFRQVRQVAWTNSSDQDEQCILNCADQLKAAVQPFLHSSNRIPKFHKKQHSSRLNKVCSALRPAIQCFDQCGSSILKSSVSISLDPIKYICVDRFDNFKDNVRCIQKMAPTSQSRCSEHCESNEESVNQMKQLGETSNARNFYSQSEIRDILSGTCQYIQCFLDCSLPMIRAACGDTAAELIPGITQRMMASLQHFDNLASGGQILPQSCKQLAQSGDNGDTPMSVLEPDSEDGLVEDNGANPLTPSDNSPISDLDADPEEIDQGSQANDRPGEEVIAIIVIES